MDCLVRYVADYKRVVFMDFEESHLANECKDMVFCTFLKYSYNRRVEVLIGDLQKK